MKSWKLRLRKGGHTCPGNGMNSGRRLFPPVAMVMRGGARRETGLSLSRTWTGTGIRAKDACGLGARDQESRPRPPPQTWGSRPPAPLPQTQGSRSPARPPQTQGSRTPAPQHLGHWLQIAEPVSLSPKSCLSGSEASVPLVPRSGSQGPSAPGVLEPRCLSPPHPTPGAHHGCGCLQAHGAPAQDQNQETHHRHPVVGEEGWDWSSGVPNLPPHRFPSQITSQPYPSPTNLWSQEDNS